MSDDPQCLIMGAVRRGGRPCRAEVPSTARITVRLTPQERSALEQVAADNRQSILQVVREAVNCFVADYGERVIFTPSGDRLPRR